MGDQEILEKAMAQAINNGWDGSLKGAVFKDKDTDELVTVAREVIFNHSFAKALWGEEKGFDMGDGLGDDELWEVRLMEMVIADDPIKYLGDNLD